MALGLLSVPDAGRAADQEHGGRQGQVYNPYPPGILPDDLRREMDRVQKEIRGIFKQALEEFRALPPPNFQGNPPTLQGTGYDAIRILGKLLNFDEKMSVDRNQACSFCHMPYAALADRSRPSI
jgi:hypothetical protein